MSNCISRTRLRICILFLFAFALQYQASARSHAGELDALDNSLREVPADVGFYVAFLRNREQVEIVAQSKAWKKLWSMTGIEEGWKMLRANSKDFSNGMDEFQKWFQDPENREPIDVLIDLFSDDVFVYGGANVAQIGDLLGQIWGSSMSDGFRRAMEEARTGKKRPPQTSDEDVARLIFDVLIKNPQAAWVPDLVLGCRTKKPELVRAQIKKLEKLIRADLDKYPDQKDVLQWTKVDGHDFLTLTIDSKSLKFDEKSVRKYEKKAGQYDALVDRIKKLRIMVSIGVRGQYVLLALGESTKPLVKPSLGKRLIDRPEMKTLARFADQRLTSISYRSKALRSGSSASMWDVHKWVDAGMESLPHSELPAEVQTRIKKDLTDLSKELEEVSPGADLGFAFLTDRGIESYEYDWTPRPSLDGSKSMTILDYVGGAPLVVVAGRSKYSPDAWSRLVHWAQVAYGYFEDFALPQMMPEQRREYEESMKIARPLLARLDTATGQMFLPSLADGQQALVIDAKLSSKRWIMMGPQSTQPIRALEPALVISVSDADLLRKAMAEYRSIFNEWMDAAHKLKPDQVPQFQVSPPESRKIKGGTAFFYPLPAAWGLDQCILPNASLSEKIAALTLSQNHSERLLASKPFRPAGRPLADIKQPMAGATYVDIAGFIDLFAHWSKVALSLAIDSDQKAEKVLKTAETILDILKVLRSYSSRTYSEGDAWVTHAEWMITDIK